MGKSVISDDFHDPLRNSRLRFVWLLLFLVLFAAFLMSVSDSITRYVSAVLSFSRLDLVVATLVVVVLLLLCLFWVVRSEARPDAMGMVGEVQMHHGIASTVKYALLEYFSVLVLLLVLVGYYVIVNW